MEAHATAQWHLSGTYFEGLSLEEELQESILLTQQPTFRMVYGRSAPDLQDLAGSYCRVGTKQIGTRYLV